MQNGRHEDTNLATLDHVVLTVFSEVLCCATVYTVCGYTHRNAGRASSVGIATRYWLDGPGIKSRSGARFSAPVQTGPGAHPASCTMGTGSFQGVMRAGLVVDHPPHLAPRLKKE